MIFKDETSKKIIYRLEGQGVNEYFRVDKRTGKIEVVLPLDRDPPGIPVWRFIVQAIDDDGKGLIGYADVQVISHMTDWFAKKRKQRNSTFA